jgi:diphosphoinositol-polyphosphate diphosphatase
VRYLPGREGAAGVEVLMISSRGGKGYVFPKGGWEEDETVETAAQRETVEEAGVRGVLELPLLGVFAFASGKAERLAAAAKGRCCAYMFAMRVSEELQSWPEAAQRQRVWCPLGEAYGRARYDWMREALRAFVERKGWELAAVVRAGGGGASPANGGASPSPSPVAPAAAGEAAGAGPQPMGPEPPGIAVQT